VRLDHSRAAKPQSAATPLSDACLQKEVKKLKEADKDGTQTVIVSGPISISPLKSSAVGLKHLSVPIKPSTA